MSNTELFINYSNFYLYQLQTLHCKKCILINSEVYSIYLNCCKLLKTQIGYLIALKSLALYTINTVLPFAGNKQSGDKQIDNISGLLIFEIDQNK